MEKIALRIAGTAAPAGHTQLNLYGADLDSPPVLKLQMHAVMVANHVNPKLQTISCQRRQLRSSSLRPASSPPEG